MPLLGVNIDHVATVRQARRGALPNILEAAQAAVAGGADSVTVHLREDRRHIQDKDVSILRKSLNVRLNMEMAATPDMVRVARLVRPHSVCLVPEKRQELTTEGGLDVMSNLKNLQEATSKLKVKGIGVSFFVDPVPEQIRAAKTAGANAVELHTGAYANAPAPLRVEELIKLQKAADEALSLGLILNAGHGLDYDNVFSVAAIARMNELNIGFSIICRALFVGLERAVSEMKERLMTPPQGRF